MTMLHSAEEASRVALEHAALAASHGTFGVGALLVDDRSGEVLDAVSNDVVRELPVSRAATEEGDNPSHLTHDPTAHGERQLITRYFERVRGGRRLPSPAELTIVSSLEPCAMCSGAILNAGFKVGVVALDRVAGIGASGGERFTRLPGELRRHIASSFGYYEVSGLRPFTGSREVAFGGGKKTRVVIREVHDACAEVFLGSLESAMAVVGEGSSDTPARDPFDLDSTDPLRVDLTERLPNFLSLRLPDPREASPEIFELLEDLARRGPGRGSSAALVDSFGNLMIASGGGPVDDPTASGFTEVVRVYSQTRFELALDRQLSGPGREYLAHPKFGTIFRYPVPDPDSPLTLFELGAYGSTMEGPIPPRNRPNLRFIGEGADAARSQRQLRELVDAMPPFYSETVGLDFEIILV